MFVHGGYFFSQKRVGKYSGLKPDAPRAAGRVDKFPCLIETLHYHTERLCRETPHYYTERLCKEADTVLAMIRKV